MKGSGSPADFRGSSDGLGFGLPYSAGLLRVHGLAFLAAESFAKLVEVLHASIDTPTARRVGVYQRRLASGLFGLVLAPHLGKSQEIALFLGVAIDLVVYGFALRCKCIEQCQVGDAQAAVVGSVLTQGQLAIELLCWGVAFSRGSLKAAVFIHFAVGSLGKLLPVLGSLPFAQVALAVV